MKYTKEERPDIGRQIYDGRISRYKAAEQYGISTQTARDYMRMYQDTNRLPLKRGARAIAAPLFITVRPEYKDIKTMTNEKLIQELVKAQITEARLKKDTR